MVEMSVPQQITLVIFLLIASAIFLFPLIVSILTENYWYFFLFSISWLPAILIAKLGALICCD